jgi:FHA domain-containing protein
VLLLGVALLGPPVLLASTPSPAFAQFGWAKKLLGKKKKPAPPPAAPAGAPQAQQPGAPPAAPATPSAAGGAPAAPAGALGSQAPGAAPGDAAAQRQAERDTMMAYGRRLDSQQPQTAATAKERLDYWEGIKLSGGVDPEVFQRYQQALRDFDQLHKQDSVRRAGDSSAAAVNARIERATRALQARDLDGAQTSVDEILAANPDNQRALFLKDRITALQKAKRFKIVLFGLGAALLVLGAAVAAFAGRILKKDKDGDAKSAAAPGAGKQKVLLKVIDGVGRGKLYTMEGDVLRIGAAESDKPEEHNDVVISDSATAVSRFHCSIIRRGKDYFLVDSSLNGTEVNDKPLDRGEHHRLDDGDEFTLAAVSRLKFLRA